MLCRLFVILALLALPGVVRADAFDNYINPLLAKVPQAKSVRKLDRLSTLLMVEHSRALPNITSAFVVVKTNEARWAKLLLLPARQKISEKDSVPIVLIDRYVTYREGEERTIHASGQNLRLFDGFRFNLDIGQVVPTGVSADLRVVDDKDGITIEPIGKAEMYLVTKHLPEANPKKTDKLVVGEKFEIRYFAGQYKLYDDGRRSGTLHLKIAETGEVTGHYYSDKDGAKYEVSGKVSNTPTHRIDFLVSYPRATQTFTGYLFTGDGRAITGTSRLQGHETGFYAVRIE